MKNQGLGVRGWGLGAMLVTGLAVTLVTPCFSQERLLELEQSELRLTVRVYNYAQASRVQLKQAEEEAGRILRRAGVETIWLDCPLDAAAFETHPACQQELNSADLVLRILPQAMVERMPFDHSKVGFAFLTKEGPRGSMLGVFYDRIRTQARGDEAATSLGLGRAAAHEIGHMLLRTEAHSSRGIMRGDWQGRDFRNPTALLAFTPEQARLIGAEVLARVEEQRSSQVSELESPR